MGIIGCITGGLASLGGYMTVYNRRVSLPGWVYLSVYQAGSLPGWYTSVCTRQVASLGGIPPSLGRKEGECGENVALSASILWENVEECGPFCLHPLGEWWV